MALCLHMVLTRTVALREHYLPELAAAEGTEGWCEECQAWVNVMLS